MLQVMKRIQVIGPKDELGRAVDILYRAGTIHLEDATRLVPQEEIGLVQVEVEQARDIADVLSAIDAITGTLPVVEDDPLRQAAIGASMDALSHRDLVL